MTALIAVAAAVCVGFVAGAIYEATRRGGSQDLAAKLYGHPEGHR